MQTKLRKGFWKTMTGEELYRMYVVIAPCGNCGAKRGERCHNKNGREANKLGHVARTSTARKWIKGNPEKYERIRAQILSQEATLPAFVARQKDWSARTFGTGERNGGILAHIAKELEEIRANPSDLVEWLDVVILALDGYWRNGGEPKEVLKLMQKQQDVNFARTWTPAAPGEASEHVRV